MKLIEYPDGLPDGALTVVADFLRGKGDSHTAAHNAWHAQGYFQGLFLGSYTPPLVGAGAPSPHVQAAQSIRSMSREEMADFLERAGESEPEVVGASGVQMANGGFSLLQLIAILRQVMELLFPSAPPPSPWGDPSSPRPMGQSGAAFTPASPPLLAQPMFGQPGENAVESAQPQMQNRASQDEQGKPQGSTPPGPANRPDQSRPRDADPQQRPSYIPPRQRADQSPPQAKDAQAKEGEKGTAPAGRRQTGNSG